MPIYGLPYIAGILLHFALGWRIAKRYNLRRRVWLTISFCYLFGMIVGAKVLFDLRNGIWDLSLLLSVLNGPFN